MDRRTIKLCKIVGIVGLKEMKNSDNRCEDALQDYRCSVGRGQNETIYKKEVKRGTFLVKPIIITFCMKFVLIVYVLNYMLVYFVIAISILLIQQLRALFTIFIYFIIILFIKQF